MRKKRPRPATLDEVRISRHGEDAIIEFLDSTVATMHLKLGPGVQQMTDEEIDQPPRIEVREPEEDGSTKMERSS